MTPFQLAAILLVLAAVFSYLNYRYIRLPTTIGVMLIALVASLVVITLDEVGWLGAHRRANAAALLASINFDTLVLQGMLSFLLFAGALHIDLADLRQQTGAISALSTVG